MHRLLPLGRRVIAIPLVIAALAASSVVMGATYPPQIVPNPSHPQIKPQHGNSIQGLIFTNTHNYGVIKIKVEVFDNYLGDFTKYLWVYTVTNFTYDPAPGISNGFTGFELALPQFVPDIANITAPDGIGPWVINCCSGLPVEWDLRNSDDTVGGGTMPGQTEQYTFTTSPRLITVSSGWFHTWQFNSQTDIINYPVADAPEVPDVLSNPDQERCCYQDAVGAWQCQIFPAGQCASLGGTVVPDCQNCPPVTPVGKKSWGKVKTIYR